MDKYLPGKPDWTGETRKRKPGGQGHGDEKQGILGD